jgi:hypothetical protein
MLSGQTLTPVTPKILKQHRDEYIQAMEEWQKGDATLEKDLHTAPREALLDRINKEATRTAKYLESKKTYFTSLRTYYQDQYVRVEGSVGGGTKPPDTKEAIQERIDGVSRERHELEERIKNTPDAEIRNKMGLQQAALKSIEDSLNDQKYLIEKWGRSEEGIVASRKEMLASLKKITDILSEQENGTAEIGTLMGGVYESMRQVAGKPLVSAIKPPVKPVDPPKKDGGPVGPPEQPKPVVEQAKPATPAGLTGSWMFLAQPTQKALPSKISLEIIDKGDEVTGTLTAYTVPKSMGFPSGAVSFKFTGPKKGANWSFEPAAKTGFLEILPVPSGIEVVWKDDHEKIIFDGLFNRK